MFKCASLGVFVVAMFLISNIAPHVRRVWINPADRNLLKSRLDTSAKYEQFYLEKAKECPQCPSTINSTICAPYYSFETGESKTEGVGNFSYH